MEGQFVSKLLLFSLDALINSLAVFLDLKFGGLCFIQVIPFPLFELQSKWVAGILSGWIKVPSKDEMMEDVKAIYSKQETRGWPKRYTHNFSGGYQVRSLQGAN